MFCEVCDEKCEHILSLGYIPPPNDFRQIGEEPRAQLWMPTELYACPNCDLVQLGHVAKPEEVFPASYPYTSGVTKQLHDNFDDLATKVIALESLKPEDLVLDVGSNDGTLLSKFKARGHETILGVEPTDTAHIAIKNGIPTVHRYFDANVPAAKKASVITMCNCFAHIPDVHAVVENVKKIMAPDGLFVSESHYLWDLVERCQYDTIYHEHIRYYSFAALEHLFGMHDLHIEVVEQIPTHGGSIRVYARRGKEGGCDFPEPVGDAAIAKLKQFADVVYLSRSMLLDKLNWHRKNGQHIVGIGMPSRGSVVLNYCRLDAPTIDAIYEQPGSLKIGKYAPGTSIPVVAEPSDSIDADCAVLFSWHIADELVPKLRAKGFKGDIIPSVFFGKTL